MKPACGFLASLLLMAFAATSSFAAPPVPEALTYKVLWAGMRVGHSSIETHHNDDHLKLISRVATDSWSRLFYKIEDVETSLLMPCAEGFTLKSYQLSLQEGANNWQRRYAVDQESSLIEQTNLVSLEKQVYSFGGRVWDPVSSLYSLRQLPLSPGLPVVVTVIDRQGPKPIDVVVLRRETVSTPAGIFRTLVVRAQMNLQSEGLLYAPGPLTVWLTDDDQRTPVVIEKRIQGLFDRGVPAWLKFFVPSSVKQNPVVLETVRAELM